jgi:hypothetical protein
LNEVLVPCLLVIQARVEMIADIARIDAANWRSTGYDSKL